MLHHKNKLITYLSFCVVFEYLTTINYYNNYLKLNKLCCDYTYQSSFASHQSSYHTQVIISLSKQINMYQIIEVSNLQLK